MAVKKRDPQSIKQRLDEARLADARADARRLSPEIAKIDERARTTFTIYASTRDVESLRMLAGGKGLTLQALIREVLRSYLTKEVGTASKKLGGA